MRKFVAPYSQLLIHYSNKELHVEVGSQFPVPYSKSRMFLLRDQAPAYDHGSEGE